MCGRKDLVGSISMPPVKSRRRASSEQIPPTPKPTINKMAIPKALREQVWIQYAGRCFERKCLIPWCENTMTVFDFHVGHNIPESLGGATDINNLRPICARCNLSMGNQYTVDSWSTLTPPRDAGHQTRWWSCLRRIFKRNPIATS